MDIQSYLLELIANHKTIGIKALGSLYKKKTPGRYDSETNSFLPPKHDIAFSTNVVDDTVLVDFISEKRNISIESADYYINEFVERIQAQLADDQHADFSPFGELKIVDGEIVLEPSSNDLNFDFYGFPPVSADVRERSSPETEKEEIPQDIADGPTPPSPLIETEQQESDQVEPLPMERSELNDIQTQNELEERVDSETLSDQPVVGTATSITDPLWKPTVIDRYEYNEEDDEDEKSGGWLRVLLKALLTLFITLAIAITVIYFFFPDLFYTIKGNFSQQQFESEPVVSIDPDTIPKTDTPFTDSVNKAIVLPATETDSLTTPMASNTIIYEVIGSAMRTQKKADEVILTLSRRGINAKKVDVVPGRRIKISLGTFTDLALAKKYQDSLKIKLRNPDIYIQTIKPKN